MLGFASLYPAYVSLRSTQPTFRFARRRRDKPFDKLRACPERILFGEEEATRFAEAIESDPVRLMSAASLLEATVVIESELGEDGARELNLLAYQSGLETIAFDEEQLKVARRAFRAYGKGRHPARLDYGDCFSYALSKTAGEPLLFKGDDFAKTDIESCL